MKLRFCGAARIVTGSCYWIQVNQTQVLVDCGMFQGSKKITKLNYEPFLFDAQQIDYVFLTHAHIDHSGLIPKLKSMGFNGKVITTPATIDLCEIMLEDSGSIQESETERENRRRKRLGLPARRPLYTVKAAKRAMKNFFEADYDELYPVTKEISVRYRDAGHIIGSAIIELFIKENGQETKLVFSGDLGQWNVPIIQNPTFIEEADYLFIESTYGDRLHKDITKRDELLLKVIVETYQKGGKLFIPSFAIERTQELLYSLNKLKLEGKLPHEKIYLDSPLAIKATEIFKKHRELYDYEALTRYEDPLSFSNLVYVHSARESAALNESKEPCVIIAGSGMCTGGRIRHHFKHGLWNPQNTVLFVGYQAEGTLGRYILEGAKKVKMMGMEIVVKADIEKINSFSAHADYRELLKWAGGFKQKPRMVFVVHGEETSASAFQEKLRAEGFNTYLPVLGESLELPQ
ncbi:MBL fold metallo-hydrolase [bacterium]|nr:MBL fold metallo-hydrolase [bacterium]